MPSPKEVRVTMDYAARKLRTMSNDRIITMQPEEVIYRYGRLSLAYTATLEKLQALERQCEQLTKQVEGLTKHADQQEQAPNAT